MRFYRQSWADPKIPKQKERQLPLKVVNGGRAGNRIWFFASKTEHVPSLAQRSAWRSSRRRAMGSRAGGVLMVAPSLRLSFSSHQGANRVLSLWVQKVCSSPLRGP